MDTIDDPLALDRHYAKKGGWQNSGKLLLGRENPQVTVQQTLQSAHTVTAQFQVTYPVELHTHASYIRAEAEILWSVAGHPLRRLVNCVNGISVTGSADHFDIKISDKSFPFPGFEGTEYSVSVNVTPGTRASFLAPPTLDAAIFHILPAPDIDQNFVGQVTIAPGDSCIFPVPQDAGVTGCMLHVSPVVQGVAPLVPSQDYSIKLQDQFGVIIATFYTLDIWIPFNSGVFFVVVTDESSTLDLDTTCLFMVDG